jgi:hypothetical protein
MAGMVVDSVCFFILDVLYYAYHCRLFEKRIDGVFIVYRASHTVKERQETPNQEQSWDGKPRVRILKPDGRVASKPNQEQSWDGKPRVHL